MEEDFNEYYENKILLEKLRSKENSFRQDLEEIMQEQKKKMEDLIELNLKIQEMKENLDDRLRTQEDQENDLGTGELLEECKKTVEKFIHELPKEKHEAKNLMFKIEYGKNVYTWKIEEESTTFLRLKQETKNQFNRNPSEFFFADMDNNIFLDEMNVKKALFPLSSVIIVGFQPTIKVIDNKIAFQQVEKTIVRKNENTDDEVIFSNKKLSISDKIVNHFKSLFFDYLKLIFFIIFMVVWISSGVFFRNSGEYKVMISHYKNLDFNVVAKYKDFLPNLKTKVATILQMPLEKESKDDFKYVIPNLSLFNQVNRVIFSLRLTQQRLLDSTKCNFTRIDSSTLNFNTCTLQNTDIKPWKNGGNIYNYTQDYNKELIIGERGIYDNSGYSTDIATSKSWDYYEYFNNLIYLNWIDSKTNSILLTMNYYNPSHDLFLTVRVLYEKIDSRLKQTNIDYGITDLTPVFNYYLILSIIAGSIVIILMMLSLKLPSDQIQENRKIKIKKRMSFLARIKFFFTSIIEYFQNNYRKPDFFEAVTMVNFVFFFILLIFYFSHYSKVANVKFGIGEYTELVDYRVSYSFVTNLTCGNMLIFLFAAMTHIRNFSSQLKEINDSLITYLNKILPFTFGFLIFLIMITAIVSYFFTGGYFVSYYREFSFVYLKIIQSFFRGSIDNIDNDSTFDQYTNIPPPNSTKTFNQLLQDSTGSYNSIINDMSTFGYLIISVIFFFIANFIVKVAHTAMFLIEYRKIYEATENEKEKERRKAEIAKSNEEIFK